MVSYPATITTAVLDSNPEPVYRRCEKEFKHFIQAFTEMLTEADPQIPPLPPKDVIHRIYRDVRVTAFMHVASLTKALDSVQQ